MEPAAGRCGAGHSARALSREFLVKGAIGVVVLVGPQGAHDQRPFFGGQAQARPRKTIGKKGRIRRKRVRGQFILRSTGTTAFKKSALLINLCVSRLEKFPLKVVQKVSCPKGQAVFARWGLGGSVSAPASSAQLDP